MTAVELRHCPGPETLAEFVEGTLPREEMVPLIGHLHSCGICRDMVGDLSKLQREEASDDDARATESTLHYAGWWWLPAAAALLLITISGSLLFERFRDPFRELITAAPKTERFIQPRLSAKFRWAPYTTTRSERDVRPSTLEKLRFDRAAAKTLDRTASSNDVEALHIRGVIALMTGEPAEAITRLTHAARIDQRNERILNDLAAAYFVHRQYRRAVEVTDQVLKLDPSYAVARFNRALALERLGKMEEARKEWSRYLQIETHGPWAKEARDHLDEPQ